MWPFRQKETDNHTEYPKYKFMSFVVGSKTDCEIENFLNRYSLLGYTTYTIKIIDGWIFITMIVPTKIDGKEI